MQLITIMTQYPVEVHVAYLHIIFHPKVNVYVKVNIKMG